MRGASVRGARRVLHPSVLLVLMCLQLSHGKRMATSWDNYELTKYTEQELSKWTSTKGTQGELKWASENNGKWRSVWQMIFLNAWTSDQYKQYLNNDKKFDNAERCLQAVNSTSFKNKWMCGGNQGGDTSPWRSVGCTGKGYWDFWNHARPCDGTITQPVHCCGNRGKGEWETNLKMNMRFVKYESNLDDKEHDFFTLTIKGRNMIPSGRNWTDWMESGEECSMDYSLRLGVCKTCDCNGGLVAFETHSKLLTDPKDHDCSSWYMKAVTHGEMYFGMDRMHAMVQKNNECKAELLSQARRRKNLNSLSVGSKAAPSPSSGSPPRSTTRAYGLRRSTPTVAAAGSMPQARRHKSKNSSPFGKHF